MFDARLLLAYARHALRFLTVALRFLTVTFSALLRGGSMPIGCLALFIGTPPIVFAALLFRPQKLVKLPPFSV